MKLIYLLCIVLFLGCGNAQKDIADSKNSNSAQDTELTVVNYDALEPMLNKKNDSIYVVNFWATWCAPCVKELPHFEKLQDNYKAKGVNVLLVSLDFPRQYDKKLKPFIKENDLHSKVVALNDTDQNRWIPAIDDSWSGAIPATLIYDSTKRRFYEQTFTYDSLLKELKQFL